MKKVISNLILNTFYLIALFSSSILFGQTTMKINKSNFRIDGTSTFHDWYMATEKSSGTANITFNPNGSIKSIDAISLTIAAKDLKSGEGSIMDKNAYKAMKAEANPSIIFKGNSTSISTNDGINYTFNLKGTLAMSGATKNIELVAYGKINPDKSLTVNGSKNLDITEWTMKPPVFMGVMKTGKDVVLKFNTTLVK